MKAITLLSILALVLVANCSSLRALDEIKLADDVKEESSNTAENDDKTYQKVWNQMIVISKVSLGIVCVLWTLLVCRFFSLFKTRYEHVSTLMTVLALPLFYTVFSYISIADKDMQGHLDLLRTFYEVILLFGVFNLMKTYVGYDVEANIFRPEVLYEAIRRHEKIALFSLPIEDPREVSKLGFFRGLLNRFRKFFYFPLTTTEEAKTFVESITTTLWIFGGLRLVSLLVDIVVNSDDGISLFLETVGVLAMTVAIGYSYLFVHVVEKEIPQVKANRKFWSIKIFLSLTFYQVYILDFLLYYEYKTVWTGMDDNLKNELMLLLGDTLICCEMALFCLLLVCAFPYSNFKKVEVFVGTQLYKKYKKQKVEDLDMVELSPAHPQDFKGALNTLD